MREKNKKEAMKPEANSASFCLPGKNGQTIEIGSHSPFPTYKCM
jgi:hypothetical protein